MVYISNIQPSSFTPQEKLLAERVKDMLNVASEKNVPKYTSFLDERQQLVAQWACSTAKIGVAVFFGGYEQAQRKIFAAIPDYMSAEDTDGFPLSAVTVKFPTQYTLTHRDFLGALMNLMIKRETLGDILVGEGIGVIFARDTVASVIVQELIKIGSVGVKCTMGAPMELPLAQELAEISGTVSSLRIDVITAFLTKESREQVSALIKSGLVAVNSSVAAMPSRVVAQGDKIAVRGYGKFVLTEIGGITKKDRIHITCHKYI